MLPLPRQTIVGFVSVIAHNCGHEHITEDPLLHVTVPSDCIDSTLRIEHLGTCEQNRRSRWIGDVDSHVCCGLYCGALARITDCVIDDLSECDRVNSVFGLLRPLPIDSLLKHGRGWRHMRTSTIRTSTIGASTPSLKKEHYVSILSLPLWHRRVAECHC